jgi:hypothetical protein
MPSYDTPFSYIIWDALIVGLVIPDLYHVPGVDAFNTVGGCLD